MFVMQGMKATALEHPWSTMVSMVFFPFTWGRPVIRSSAIWEKGFMSGVIVIPNGGVFLL